MQYFFYGTLMDRLILHAVLRRTVNPQRLRAAVLPGWSRVYRHEATYPVIIPNPVGEVSGILASGLTTRDEAFLQNFEGSEYDIGELPVRLVSGGKVHAKVFLPGPSCPASSTLWTPEDWQRRFRKEFLRRVLSDYRAPNTKPDAASRRVKRPR